MAAFNYFKSEIIDIYEAIIWASCGSFFLTLILNCRAALEWDALQVSQTVDPLADIVLATFHFKNVGDKAVTIQEVKPSCGCTTVALAKTTYAPGESGDIVAKLTIGSRQGQQNKTIRVTSDDRKTPVILSIKTLITKVLGVQPAFVFWQKDEVPDVKTITLTHGVEGMHIVKAQSDNSNVAVSLDTVEAGKRYRLTVTPTSTDELVKARITLTTDFPKDNKTKTFYVFAHVK